MSTSPTQAFVRTAGAVVLCWSIAVVAAPFTDAQVAPDGSGEVIAEDPGLSQQIAEDQATASGDVEIAAGHVDLGPRFVDGAFTLMLHDDSSDPSVWRDPDEAVLRIGDLGQRPAPDDPAYGFLGATPGQPVWVVSQTEIPGVVWLGWNTQDPDVMERIDRGVTLSMLGAQGPGQVSLYLQSGAFGEPDVLWRSVDAEPGTIWVDTNTHTHANWVFTEPGVYLVRIGAVASIGGDDRLVATTDLRIAVGDATPVDGVRTASWQNPPPDPVVGEAATGAAVDASTSSTGADDEPGGSSTLVIVVVVALAAVIAGISVASQSRTRRLRAEADRMRGST